MEQKSSIFLLQKIINTQKSFIRLFHLLRAKLQQHFFRLTVLSVDVSIIYYGNSLHCSVLIYRFVTVPESLETFFRL
jgi:hypothetical protein